jgi:hypothetical protein
MNWKNARSVVIHPNPRKGIAGLCGRVLLLIALLLAGNACHRRKAARPQTPSVGSPMISALSFSCALSPAEGFGDLTTLNQATLAEEKDRLLIRATGTDTQLGFRVTPSARFAISLDIGSPAATVVELFYQVQNQSYSAEHVVQAPLKAGRNRLLLSVDDPLFSGGIRLDPGQIAGDYSLYSLQIFSHAPVSFVRPVKPQAELAASFDASTATTLFFAKSSEDLAKIKALGDVLLVVDPRGLMARALGTDPALLLPEFDLNGQPIVKIVIASPAATSLQIFYKTRDQLDYDPAHATIFPLQSGENTIYIEIPVRNATGALRLDPGTVAGDYLLREIEARAITAGPH